jgi:hypothetical protein
VTCGTTNLYSLLESGQSFVMLPNPAQQNTLIDERYSLPLDILPV